jgi:hypothetical protein
MTFALSSSTSASLEYRSILSLNIFIFSERSFRSDSNSEINSDVSLREAAACSTFLWVPRKILHSFCRFFSVVIYFNIENSACYVIVSASIQLILPEMRT